MATSLHQRIGSTWRRLQKDRVTYFPIRHHSPACSFHLRRWIEEHRPASILIEGPRTFDNLIGHFGSGELVAPIAVYVSYVDELAWQELKDRAAVDVEADKAKQFLELQGPPRHAAYYPFCDFSPELVAVRTGLTQSAKVRFIDLNFPEKVRSDASLDESHSLELVGEDPHLWHSRYVARLAERMGCRDFNEVWDHLFEHSLGADDGDDFMTQLSAWCAIIREDYTEDSLRQDGTMDREQRMAFEIARELDGRAGSDDHVLIVTGGFHSIALPELVDEFLAEPERKPLMASGKLGELSPLGQQWLVPYSFDRLDTASGYASGIPSPDFYQRCWNSILSESSEQSADVVDATPTAKLGQIQLQNLVTEMLLEIARESRRTNSPARISTPDVIAAVEMSQNLATLRGHAWPLRRDLLDAATSCFVKGESSVEGAPVIAMTLEILRGDRVGTVPVSVGTPPLVDNFRQEAAHHRIELHTTATRDIRLELYRRAKHRATSRFFHRLKCLDVPLAKFTAGPDFVLGADLQRLQEHWRVQWSPSVEAALIMASVDGSTIEQACTIRLARSTRQLEESLRQTESAISLLIETCRMGLFTAAQTLMPRWIACILQEPIFSVAVGALTQLRMLHQAREPLEASFLTSLPQTIVTLFQRCCRLLADVANCPDEQVDATLRAIQSIRELTAEAREEADDDVDTSLFHTALHSHLALNLEEVQPAVVGASIGVLFAEGQITKEKLLSLFRGFLIGSSDVTRCASVVRGLLATSRETLWHIEDVLATLDATLASWQEDEFLQALPDLRLAFTDLTPNEVSRVAEHVATYHGTQDLGDLVMTDVEETEVQIALRLNQIVHQSLQEDGVND